MKKINLLPPFKNFILQNFPFIEEDFDALTNYELLCHVVNYVKTMGNDFNNIILNVEELETAFNQLKSYVDNYFDNLDVQEEINNKLDDMAESGQLTDIIAQYLGLAGMLTFSTVADMKLAENLVVGSTCETLGYYSLNDGGSAKYKVRTITNNDTVDEALLIALSDDSLVAELILDEYIKTKQMGCYGDGTHDDTTKFHKCIDYAIEKEKPILVEGTLLISSSYNLTQTNKDLIIKGFSTSCFRSTQWHNGIASRIKLINGSALLSGYTYYQNNNALPWLKLNMSDVNFFNEYTGYNSAYNNQYIIYDVRLTASLIENISSQCLNFMRGSFNRTSVLKNSRFIACYIFMQRGSEGDMISDSVISDNYISGSDTGYVFDRHTGASVRFTNNFVDYFKYIFSPTVTGNSFLSMGNVYDGYFHIFEGTTNTNDLYANIIFQNDKFQPHNKTFCVNKEWMSNSDVKTSVLITSRSYNIQFLNPQIRMPDGNNGDDVFMYGDIYGPTSKALALKIVNPTYWTPINSQLQKEPVITEILNVKNSGATLEQHFDNTQISYETTIIDRVATLPPLTRDTRYIIPPFYKCYNTTDHKLYVFDQTGAFVEVTQ